MKQFLAAFLVLFLTLVNGSQIKIDPDGGYTDLVVKISGKIQEEHLCPQILANLKVKKNGPDHLDY